MVAAGRFVYACRGCAVSRTLLGELAKYLGDHIDRYICEEGEGSRWRARFFNCRYACMNTN